MRYTSDAAMLAMQKEARKRVLDMESRNRKMAQSANVIRPIEVPRYEKQPPNEKIPPLPIQKADSDVDPNREKPRDVDIKGLFEGLFSQEGRGSFSSIGDSLQKAIGSASSPALKLLDSFGIGGEELLILMIMYMVFKERGDTSLLLALGYLLI